MQNISYRLQRVKYIPKEISAGVLYVAAEYGAALHTCACGCGARVSTPLGPTDWSLSEGSRGPTLEPSIGNWQLPCRSHYWIANGSVIWAEDWSEKRIEAGRAHERRRAEEYFMNRAPKPPTSKLATLVQWLRTLWGRRPRR